MKQFLRGSGRFTFYFIATGLVVLLLTELTWWGILRPLIQTVYANPGFPVLGPLLSGRDVHPVQHYLAHYRSLLQLGQVGLLIFTITGATAIWVNQTPNKLCRPLIGLIVIMLLSVVVRAPDIGKPMQLEQPLANSLIGLDLLWNEGFWTHKGGMPRTFPGETNRFIRNLGMTAFNADGLGYYLTFPPLAIHVAYGLHRLFNTPPTVGSVQTMATSFHLLGTAAFFALMCGLFKDRPQRYALAWWASLPVAFSAVALWYFGHLYSPDFFWPHLFVLSLLTLYFLVQRIERHQRGGWLWACWICSVFAVTYTDNHGAVYAAVAGCWGLYYMRHQRVYGLIFIAAGTGSLLAVTLMYCQYSSIMGAPLHRLLAGAATNRTMGDAGRSWTVILTHHIRALWPFLLALIGLLPGYLRSDRIRSGQPAIWHISLLLVIVHHLIFMQWTIVHDLSALKAVYPAGIALGALAGTSFMFRSPSEARRCWGAGLLAASLIMLSLMHYRTDYARATARDKNVRIAADIAAVSNDHEVLFYIAPGYVLPQTLYYLRRNIQKVDSIEEAKEWLQTHQREQGRILFFDEERELIDSTPIMH